MQGDCFEYQQSSKRWKKLKSCFWFFGNLNNIPPKCTKCSKSATLGPQKATIDLLPLRGDLNRYGHETCLQTLSNNRAFTWYPTFGNRFSGSGVMASQRNGDFSVCDLYIKIAKMLTLLRKSRFQVIRLRENCEENRMLCERVLMSDYREIFEAKAEKISR